MKIPVKRIIRIIVSLIIVITLSCPVPSAAADTVKSFDTGLILHVTAKGKYPNWDGVSNVSQFKGQNGNYWFAYDEDKYVTVVKTTDGKVESTVRLKKEHETFGAVECDSDGNFYLMTGEANTGTDTSKETVFLSKYDSTGKHVKTVGNNGSSSLADYYGDDFYTKTPFDGGNCDIAVNGDYIAINYARHMYSGHQSNSVWMLEKNELKTIDPYNYIYNSHSFGQRVIPYGDGFLFMSEGDCYPRAFTMNYEEAPSKKYSHGSVLDNEADIFHFWVKEGTLDAWDMYTLNDNFATIGDLCDLGNNTASFVASSVKAMNSDATDQVQNIFIQIFDPTKKFGGKSAFVTSGKRIGLSGPNGNEKTTDYGVKWITKYTKESGKRPSCVQAVSDDKGNTVILFELYKNYTYKGVYYCVVNSEGKVSKKIRRCSSDAQLNPCETPVYADGAVWWTGNKYREYDDKLYVYSLPIE